MQANMEQYVVAPEDGRAFSLGGAGMNIKLTGEQTRGAFAVVEHTVAPGELRPPHVHTKEDAYFYVLEGQVGARIGHEDVVAPAGAYVFHPRSVPFAFWNAGIAPARLIEIIVPAGMEQMFWELAKLLQDGGWPPSPERMQQVQESQRAHGVTQLGGAEELVAKYGVQPLIARPPRSCTIPRFTPPGPQGQTHLERGRQ